MKTAISIPDDVFEAAEKLAQRLGVPRSRLYARAVLEFLHQHRSDDVTRKLDRLYESEPAVLDPLSQALQGASLTKDEW